ncbi:MAG TPA: hypothetical protein PLX97_05680 [Gemmatales bacterium]|nr:hypothetical protein [Gemmatales bacterium]
MSSEDQSLIHRVVGTLEYVSALKHLDAFVQSASREELDAADQFISRHPQFAVNTRLSDRLRAGASSLVNTGARKLGLAWVIALARIEAGGILATFTTMPSPFELVGPTQFEMAAYKELLMDDAQTHYLALTNDLNLLAVSRKVPGTEMLAYIRRINLARSMLDAAVRSQMADLSPQDYAVLCAQDKTLSLKRMNLANRVSKYLEHLNYTRQNSSVTESEYSSANACAQMLKGELKELAAGTATVQSFNFRPVRPATATK